MPSFSSQEPSRTEIWKMFDQISSTYDRVNRAITLGIDQSWRKKMGAFLPDVKEIHLLDCATGTGDQLFSLMDHTTQVKTAVGIDLSPKMLDIGRLKLQKKIYKEHVLFKEASALAIPYTDQSFDCVTISWGIRNVTDVPACLKEMHRVLKKGGRLLILECSLPTNPLLKKLHLFYLRHLLPKLGQWLSKNQDAYRYLNATIETFPSGPAFCSLLKDAGFLNAKAHPLTFGTISLYQADRK